MPPKRKINAEDDTTLVTHPEHHDLIAHVKAVIHAIAAVAKEASIGATSQLALRPYLRKGRIIAMVVNPFIDVKDILVSGTAILNECPEDEEPDLPSYFEDICNIMPGEGRFPELLRSLSDRNDKCFGLFVSWISDKMGEGNSATTTKFKYHVPNYLHLDPDNPSSPFPITSRRDKAFRGNNSNACARALAPVADRARFDKDPHGYRKKVESGEIEITEEQWSSFLFPDDLVYDPMFPEKDFGKGHVFTRLLNAELVGPTGAHGDMPTGFSASIAARHDITAITPRIAAYVAYHAYVALSSMPSRSSMEDGNLDLVAYYDNIYELLSLDDGTNISQTILDDMTDSVPHLLKAPKSKRKKAKSAKSDRPRKNPVEEAAKMRKLRAESDRLNRAEQRRKEKQLAQAQGQPNSSAQGAQGTAALTGPSQIGNAAQKSKALQGKGKGLLNPNRIVDSDSDREDEELYGSNENNPPRESPSASKSVPSRLLRVGSQSTAHTSVRPTYASLYLVRTTSAAIPLVEAQASTRIEQPFVRKSRMCCPGLKRDTYPDRGVPCTWLTGLTGAVAGKGVKGRGEAVNRRASRRVLLGTDCTGDRCLLHGKWAGMACLAVLEAGEMVCRREPDKKGSPSAQKKSEGVNAEQKEKREAFETLRKMEIIRTDAAASLMATDQEFALTRSPLSPPTITSLAHQILLSSAPLCPFRDHCFPIYRTRGASFPIPQPT
ncbi:hypothetical protein NMY22_g10173 [Coprinellus aureogranulatus]|nr:hypothetical protein NMY22_g10173 [Coprinellus aureogranulatus]